MGLVPQQLSILEEERNHFRYFALQPIFSAEFKVVAYEALYRSGLHDFFCGDGDEASRLMIDNEFLFGYEGIAGHRPVFLNCTRDTLQSGLLTMLPDWVGVEILETVEPDEEVLDLCYQLKSLGHMIALDDFEETAYPPETIGRLYDLADFVKIEVRVSTGEIGARLKKHANRKRIKTVAEKIESEAEFHRAVSLGFDLFQGRYLRPPVTYARRIHRVGAERLRILFDHLDLDLFSDCELVEAIKCVPPLEHRLMRRISWLTNGENSATTVYAAIQLIGRSELRKLIALSLRSMKNDPVLQEKAPSVGFEREKGLVIPGEEALEEGDWRG